MEENNTRLNDVIQGPMADGRNILLNIFDLDDVKDAEDVPRVEGSMMLSIFGLDESKDGEEMSTLRADGLISAVDEEINEEHSRLAFAVMNAGIQGQNEHEVKIREQLAKAEMKREITLNQLWMLPRYAEEELHLDAVEDMREMFMNSRSDAHPLLQKAFDLIELHYVRVLVRTAQRFQIRIEQLNDRIGRDSLTIREFDGWREEHDEEGKQYFVNDEGLVRVDVPAEWMNEEFDRERRYEENNLAIENVEEFVMSRVDNLLYEINEEAKKCVEVAREIEMEMEKEKMANVLDQDLIDARAMVEGIVRTVSHKVLKFFYYEAPRIIPGIPPVGVTNAYSQRRLRVRPNFHQELEEFFDGEENS